MQGEWTWTWQRGGATVVFTSRTEGNLAQHVGDDPDVVLTRRRAVAEAAGLSMERVASVNQVHGADVWMDLATEGTELSADMHWLSKEEPGVRADALVTTRSGIALSVAVADCMPIAIVLGDAIAAVHVGWRSLEAGILEAALATLQRAAGSSASLEGAGPFAVIGPSLGPCCFEIGEDVAARFPASSLVRKDGASKPHLDARADAKRRLQLRGAAVDVIDVCTKCDPRLFSHRGGGVRALGRQVMLVTRSAQPRT